MLYFWQQNDFSYTNFMQIMTIYFFFNLFKMCYCGESTQADRQAHVCLTEHQTRLNMKSGRFRLVHWQFYRDEWFRKVCDWYWMYTPSRPRVNVGVRATPPNARTQASFYCIAEILPDCYFECPRLGVFILFASHFVVMSSFRESS